MKTRINAKSVYAMCISFSAPARECEAGQRTEDREEEEEEEGGWLVVNLQMVETVQVAVLQKFLHLPPQADYTKEPFSFFALQPHIERDCSTNCSNISHPGSLSTFLTSLATSFIRTPFFSLLPFSPAAAHQGSPPLLSRNARGSSG